MQADTSADGAEDADAESAPAPAPAPTLMTAPQVSEAAAAAAPSAAAAAANTSASSPSPAPRESDLSWLSSWLKTEGYEPKHLKAICEEINVSLEKSLSTSGSSEALAKRLLDPTKGGLSEAELRKRCAAEKAKPAKRRQSGASGPRKEGKRSSEGN
eukprot:CAMPEP_0202785888 /NCGR_PEP_ID=MMETSP1388-20130828/69199_1 /ASSEMBLY_ACC=CAM_ASM_000864 /TAXON_ID=37098 /ORGANISM="Isochrysis sp, Strain CCMP1244" /LENGTH=156 /DNA_ID=CAMNT_0049455431 /DNA_START=286 /DNA_END=753 /DNA_ORIENTATION=-